MSEPEVKTQLRLPPELHAEIKALAEQDRRSLNAEIVVLVEEAIAARKHVQATKEPFTTGSTTPMFRSK